MISLDFARDLLNPRFEGEPAARLFVRAADRGIIECRSVAKGTEGQPLSAGAYSAAELDAPMNTNFLRMLLLEPLKLLAQIVTLRARKAKLNLQLGILRLECSYLAFQCRRLLQCKVKARLENVGDREFEKPGAEGIENAHCGDCQQPPREVKR